MAVRLRPVMESTTMTRRVRKEEEEIILTLLIGSMTLLPINVTLKGCEVEVMQKTFNTFDIFPNFQKIVTAATSHTRHLG